ncbi:NUMOD4 domain-containing protein [Bacillus cereus group sp. TH153LC]|uniref:HNH endonuclease n=1 Tax=Bacillus cereus group sp. TH153LC TaxID=3018059 RepID=UPI0022E4ED50|nr:NUMOD4 domain-containing protein [Bacillus cereus group sp. TH153LC]MDA1660371.1 NUMOD4 domain-containing protein [Bacillus cereus group sp. TH153LC]
MEKWKQFEETERKKYFVSTLGRIMSIEKATGEEYFHRIGKQTSGYTNVRTSKTKYVHRIVANTFIPNPENKPTVNHLNGLFYDNRVENLEWATHKEQAEHARKLGLKTDEYTPMIILDSNGEVIGQYETTVEALSNYNGRQIHYSKDVQIIGNVVVMKQSYYDKLSEDERFNICYECFQHMMEFVYVVDNQLVENGRKTAEMLNYSYGTLPNTTKNKWSTDINGHTVSRFKNRIGVFNDVNK